jgi:hypothetical protein
LLSADPGTGHSVGDWVLADDAHKMRDLGNHATHLRRVRQLGEVARSQQAIISQDLAPQRRAVLP